MSAPSSLSLPQELIDLIVGHFASDKMTLKMSSLVSRSFCASAQRHIFRHISFVLTHDRQSVRRNNERLSQICASSPTTWTLVQSLHISRLNPSFIDPELLIQTIRLMPNLTKLSIRGRGILSSINDNTKFEPQFWAECCRPTIKALSLGRLREFDPTFLSACTALDHLSITRTTMSSFPLPDDSLNADDGARPTPPAKARSLYLDLSECHYIRDVRLASYLQRISGALDLSELKHLSLTKPQSTEDYEALVVWLKTLPLAINSFAIDAPIEISQPGTILWVQVSWMPRLTSLTLVLTEEQDWPGTITQFPWLISQLDNFPGMNILHTLNLMVMFLGDATLDQIQGKPWDKLDNSVSDQRFGEMKVVNMTVCYDDDALSVALDELEVMRILSRTLPRTSAKKSVQWEILKQGCVTLEPCFGNPYGPGKEFG